MFIDLPKLILMKIYSFIFLIIVLSTSNLLNAQSASPEFEELYNNYKLGRSAGDHDQALAILQRILFLDNLSAYHTALIYNNIGLTYWELGNYTKSNFYYEKALVTCMSVDYPYLKLKAAIINNVAILQNQIGDYGAALDYYQQARSLLNKLKSQDAYYFSELSKVLFNIALVHFKQASYAESIDNLNNSLNIKEKNNLGYRGSIHFNLARCYSAIDLAEKANDYFKQSINQWTVEFDSSYRRLGGVYLEYGQFLLDQGNDSLGLSYYDKAIENYLTNYGKHHTYTASAYHLTSEYYLQNLDFELAFEYIQLALASVCPGFDNSDISANPVDQQSLLDLRLLKIYKTKIEALAEYAKDLVGHINRSESKDTEAAHHLELAIETNMEAIKVLNRIQKSYLSQESRLYLAENQKAIFITGIENALQLHKLTGKKEYEDLAYYFASIGKTLELNFEMARKEELYLKSQSDSTAIKLVSTKESMDSYTNLIQMEQMKSNSDSTKISKWQSERFELSRDYEKQHDAVFGQEIETVNIQLPSDSFISNIQANLGRRHTSIEYALSKPDSIGKRTLFAFITNKNGLKIHQTELDSDFSRNLKIVQVNLNELNPVKYSLESREDLDSSLKYFYKILVEPLEDLITGHQIVIVPDDELSRIPYGALIKIGENQTKSQDKTSYLFEKYELSYALNTKQISKGNRTLISRRPEVRIIAHSYSGDEEVLGPNEETNSKININSLQKLDAAEEEAEGILNIMKGRWIKETLGKKEIVTEMKEAEILHFAMHSEPSNEDLTSSFLALGPEFDSAYSNLLFDYEIEPLNLNAELVVLNACATGDGSLYSGEGMHSLSRSFLLSGVKAVVHTQWRVNDIASSKITAEFYKGLSKGWSKAKALRNAQLVYLKESFPALRHPYYWAAYQIVGDDGPVSPGNRRWWVIVSLFLIITGMAYTVKKSMQARE